MEWDGIHQFERICISPDDDEAYEKSIPFLGKKWRDLQPSVWRTHGSVGFLTPEALLYYLPSLLYWAHGNYDDVSLAIDSLLYEFSDLSGDFPYDRLTTGQICFLIDFVSLIPDSISELYGNEEYWESSLEYLLAIEQRTHH